MRRKLIGRTLKIRLRGVDMSEFIIGIITGLNFGVAITAYIYNKKINRIIDEIY